LTDSLPPAPSEPGAPDPGPDLWSGPVEVLEGGVVPAAPPRRGRGIVALTAAAVAAVLIGGAALAWAAFSGDGGDQPEQHLPATAGAFLKVDFDPSGTQKIDAVRFLAKFPMGKALEGSAGDDPRRFLYEQLTKDDRSAPPWRQVEAWLGQRVALGVVPTAAEGPAVVALLQVTDEAEARASLAEAAGTDMAYTVAGGWATISDTRAHVDAVTRGATTNTLAADATFRHDVGVLGDPGVLAGWADASRFPQLPGALARRNPLASAGPLFGTADLAKQRIALVARFTGGDAEVRLRTFGPTVAAAHAGAGAAVAALPRNTIAALGVSAGAESVRTSWRALSGRVGPGRETLAQLRRQTGLELPGDLAALLGQRFAVALGEPDASGRPVAGIRVQSDAPSLGGALDRLLRYTDRAGLPLEHRDLDGGYVLSTSRDHAEALITDGGLGTSESFRSALPEADGAQTVAYVDVERLSAAYLQDADSSAAASLRAVRAVGLTVTPTGDGTATTVRVTTR
jgi:hypothetical protein